MEKYQSPVYKVLSVPIEKIVANSYNPNIVAPPEMKLLEVSIWEDGYTMPCVCYYIPEQDIYELVDGYHRYQVMKTSKRIYEREEGKLPVVVIEKDLSNRMASTIRHNRLSVNTDSRFWAEAIPYFLMPSSLIIARYRSISTFTK